MIVGAGQAGSTVAGRLRGLGFGGQITMSGEEPWLPYERPPLSKGYLLGQVERHELYLRPQSFYNERDIEGQTDVAIHGIDREGRTVSHSDGVIEYDELVLTTGSIARSLPVSIGGDLSRVFYVRTLSDVDALLKECAPGRSALVVGGGYIGLEAAAALTKSGMDVTLIEAADRILQRVAAPETSDYFRQLHRKDGVESIEGAGLVALDSIDALIGVELSDGRVIEVDFVVIGIGVAPATWLAEQGAEDRQRHRRECLRSQFGSTHLGGRRLLHHGSRLRAKAERRVRI